MSLLSYWSSLLPQKGVSHSEMLNTLLLVNSQATKWTILQGNCQAGMLQSCQQHSFLVAEDMQSLDAEAVGLWLRGKLEHAGLEPGHAMLVLSRQDVLMWNLDFPTLDESELPDLIQCYAESQWVDGRSTPLTDWLTLSLDEEKQSTSVLAVGICRETFSRTLGIAQAAGFAIRGATLGGLHLHRFHPRDEGVYLLVAEGGAELLLRHRGINRATHAISLPALADEPKAKMLAGLVNEIVSPLESDIGQPSIYLCTSEPQKHLAAELARLTGHKVESISLQERVGKWQVKESFIEEWQILSAVPLLLPDSHPKLLLDFLHPQCPRRGRSTGRSRMLRVACSLICGAVLLGSWLAVEHQRLNESIASLQQELAATTKQLAHAEPLRVRAQAVEKWQAEQVSWVDQLSLFAQTIDSEKELIFTGFEGAADRHSGMHLLIHGAAHNKQDVLDYQRSLVNAASEYRIHPQEISLSSSSARFPVQFRIDAETIEVERDLP